MVEREQSFLVEDFVESIAAQLDRVQDTLRLKALNRPLTYALKDFSLDLNVFVTMDAEGNVRFRTSAPNEAGASTIKIGFTTITRPMIEENTVELSLTRSPTLEELGLEADERRQLHKLGVRNAAQLDRLYKRTGTATVSRFSGIPLDRLRSAIQFGKPRVDRLRPERPVQAPARITPDLTPRVPRHPDSGNLIPPQKDLQPLRPPQTDFQAIVPPRLTKDEQSPIKLADARMTPIRTAPGVDRMRIIGKNLLGAQGLPVISLNYLPLQVLEADDDEMIVALPDTPESGFLQIIIPEGTSMAFDFIMMDSAIPGALDYDYPDEYVLSGDVLDKSTTMNTNGSTHQNPSSHTTSDDMWAPRHKRNERRQP